VYSPNQFLEVMKEIHRPEVLATSLPTYFKVAPELKVEEAKEPPGKDKRKGLFK
jgi:hypothetical protein